MGTPDNMSKNEMGDEQQGSRGTVEALARNAAAREAERATWAPTNVDSDTVLARRAQQMNLGDVKTGELSISWASEDYIVQASQAAFYTPRTASRRRRGASTGAPHATPWSRARPKALRPRRRA